MFGRILSTCRGIQVQIKFHEGSDDDKSCWFAINRTQFELKYTYFHI